MSEYALNLGTVDVPASAWGCQGKVFYIKGRFWFLLADNTGLGGVYILSTLDFVSFISNVVVTPAGNQFGMGCSMAYDSDGDVLHVVWNTGVGNFYRACTPNADGTITWLAAATSGELGHYSPNITLDSNGYPWVTYWVQNGANYDHGVKKSSTKDGTWTTDAAVTKTLVTGGADPFNRSGRPCAQTGGKMYCIYTKTLLGATLFGWQYDPDSGWAAAEDTISTHTTAAAAWDATSENDDIHLAFAVLGSGDLYYQKFTYGTGWGAETSLGTITFNSGDRTFGSVTIDRKGNLYVHGCVKSPGKIRRWRYANSAWTQLDDVATTVSDPDEIASLRQVVGSNIIIFQSQSTGALYIVAYAVPRAATKVISCGL